MSKKVKISDIQNVIKTGKKIVKVIKDIGDIPPFKSTVGKLTANKYFKNIDVGLDTADKLSNIYDRTKGLKIKNVIPNNKYNNENLNRIGIENALNERKKYLDEERLNKGISRRNSLVRNTEDAERVALGVM